MIGCDVAGFVAALLFAYLMRLEFELSPRHWEQIKTILAYGIPLKIGVFFGFGLYRGMWRYSGFRDVIKVLQASIVSTLAVIAVMVFEQRFSGLSRVVFILDAIFSFLLTAGNRSATRLFFTMLNRGSMSGPGKFPAFNNRKAKPVIIIGAGDAGARIHNEIRDNGSRIYRVVCFLDDKHDKIGRTLHDIPVAGKIAELPYFVQKYKAEEIFIAVPSGTGTEMRAIIDICETTKLPFKTLPSLGEIMDGRVSVKTLRDVNYQDLLGREPVKLDFHNIADYLKGKTVLVTGCGGSIGSELCRQIIRFQPGRLLLMDACEYNLYQIEIELLQERQFKLIDVILGRVQDRALIERIFKTNRPHVVFHAAAYKHVPMLESNPWEAIDNNVEGSSVVMEAARNHGAERFVLVSSDKAVHPTNMMGASKRLAEMIMQRQPASSTRFMAVRFGNVLGSSGSVVPLFRKQIKRGGPVTVTHPDVTRYFMTIPEAVQLILQAGSMGVGGEIYVLEMGTPIRIANMAEDLIRLSGKEPGRDIQISFTGLRPGEKLFEELITKDEWVSPTKHKKIKLLREIARSESEMALMRESLSQSLKSLMLASENHDAALIRSLTKEIVPEYEPGLRE